MNKVKNYIKATLKKGYKPQAIKDYLVGRGYREDYIEEMISKLDKPKKRIRFQVKKEEDNPDPIIEPNEGKGLKSTLNEVNKRLEIISKGNTKKEHKEFSLPNKVKKQLKKLAIKNKVMVIYLTRNRSIIPMVTEIKDGFITINGTPHNCSADFMFLWKGKYPAIVLPEWDLNPIGTKDYYDAVNENRIADPVAIAIRMMESKGNPSKLKLSPKAWIFIGLAVIAGLYVLFGGTG